MYYLKLENIKRGILLGKVIEQNNVKILNTLKIPCILFNTIIANKDHWMLGYSF